MPSHQQMVADRTGDEDPGLASGDVYMDPQTMQRYEEDQEPARGTAADKAVAKNTKSPVYKAKLIFWGQNTLIGNFKSDGNHVTCKISMIACDNWSSSVKIEIKAFRSKAGPTPEHTRTDELVHAWVFRLNATSEVTQPTIDVYEKGFMGIDSALESAFIKYCVTQEDETAQTQRRMGRLAFVSLNFCPAKTHTEGILQEMEDLGKYQHIQDQLPKVFTKPDHETISLNAFFLTTEPLSFYVSYAGILEGFAVEKAFPPYTRWFNGISDAKCKVQKGQVTPRANRPLVNISSSYTYANSNECWTAEGMSIIYQQENDLQDIKECRNRECQLRILKVTPGGDRIYIGLLRLPSNFEYRFSTEDSFLVNFGTEEWSAYILPEPFPFASSIDYTIALNRPIKDDVWSELQFKSVLDLANNANTPSAEIERYCFNGKANKVKVTPVLSDIPYNFRLAAIKTLNPAHEEDRGHVHNPRWQRLIIGQDLRTKTKGDLFHGIDYKAELQAWDVKLDKSQMGALEYLAQSPNNLGVVKGPWGTGKTKVDVVVTMLLMSAGKRVKVLSPTNKAADTFVTKLNTELARLREAGIIFTNKNVVRFHSPTTEHAVVYVDSQRDIIRDTDRSRWQPVHPISLSVYDGLAADMIEKARERPHGVSDRRYQLQHASFGTLLLRIAGVIDRPHTSVDPVPTQSVAEASEAHDTNAVDGGSQTDNTETESNTEEASEAHESAPSMDSNDYEPEVGPEWNDATDLQKAVQEMTESKIREANGRTPREKLCACFREMFLVASQGGTFGSTEEASSFKLLEDLLSIDILQNDVAVLVTTLVNAGHTIIKDSFKGDHVIVQEASKAENGDVFIALAGCENSIHLSGDEQQLPPKEQDIRRNPFAHLTNKSLFKRLVTLGYPKCELTEQHRTVPGISNVISAIWYRGSVISKVDPATRPNYAKAIEAHKEMLDLDTPFIWIDTDGDSNKMGFSQSSQNERELQVAIELCQHYIEQGIEGKDIVILAGYLAQVNLTRRVLKVTKELHGVETGTIDGYQGFMALSSRPLTAISRACDSCAVITNEAGITSSEDKRKRAQYDTLREFIGPGGQVTFNAELPALDFTMHDHDLNSEMGDDNASQEEAEGETGGEAGANDSNPTEAAEEGGWGEAWGDDSNPTQPAEGEASDKKMNVDTSDPTPTKPAKGEASGKTAKVTSDPIPIKPAHGEAPGQKAKGGTGIPTPTTPAHGEASGKKAKGGTGIPTPTTPAHGEASGKKAKVTVEPIPTKPAKGEASGKKAKVTVDPTPTKPAKGEASGKKAKVSGDPTPTKPAKGEASGKKAEAGAWMATSTEETSVEEPEEGLVGPVGHRN